MNECWSTIDDIEFRFAQSEQGDGDVKKELEKATADRSKVEDEVKQLIKWHPGACKADAEFANALCTFCLSSNVLHSAVRNLPPDNEKTRNSQCVPEQAEIALKQMLDKFLNTMSFASLEIQQQFRFRVPDFETTCYHSGMVEEEVNALLDSDILKLGGNGMMPLFVVRMTAFHTALTEIKKALTNSAETEDQGQHGAADLIQFVNSQGIELDQLDEVIHIGLEVEKGARSHVILVAATSLLLVTAKEVDAKGKLVNDAKTLKGFIGHLRAHMAKRANSGKITLPKVIEERLASVQAAG